MMKNRCHWNAFAVTCVRKNPFLKREMKKKSLLAFFMSMQSMTTILLCLKKRQKSLKILHWCLNKRKQTENLRWIYKVVPGLSKRRLNKLLLRKSNSSEVEKLESRMGASSTGLKSNRGDTEDQHNQPQVIVPRLNVQDIENNNNHVIVNPQENNLHFLPLHALIDECDLLNNNTTYINNNYLTVSLTSPSSTALTTSCNKFNHKQALYRLSEQQIQSANNRKDKMLKESPKKSPKKKLDEKLTKEKKKKKEKPKAPRPAAAKGGGGKGGRGTAEQDQMMRRPRKTKKEK